MHTPRHLPILLALLLLLYLGAASAACAQDNCYRALSNRPAAATSFCRPFTLASSAIPSATPPPFASQCAQSPARISSACSCLVPPCNQDNCYRALSNRLPAATAFCQTFTTAPSQAIPTASPPPFTSQCANDAARISSACSCLVAPPTPTPTSSTGVCEPTAALDVARDGSFDQVFIPEGGAIADMPPWYFDRLAGATGDFIRLPSNANGETETGYGAAAFHVNPNSDPTPNKGGFLNAEISVCSGRTYAISFWGRIASANADPYHPACFVSLYSRLQGFIGGAQIIGSERFVDDKYSGWSYTPTVEPVSGGVGREGSVYKLRGQEFGGRGWSGWGWNDTWSMEVRCEESAVPLTAIIDAVVIV